MPTEIDWARLASFIDGEGCIDLHRHRQFRKDLGKVYARHYVRITMTNTNPKLGEWLKSTFGGCDHKEPDKKNHKWARTSRWYVHARKAADILRNCLPYFILKLEEATVALEFQATIDTQHTTGRGGLNQEVFERREQLVTELKRLKRSYKHYRKDASKNHDAPPSG